MKCVVVDTNILISATIFGGLPGHLLSLARLRAFLPATSPWLLEEFATKLQTKFRVSEVDALEARGLYEELALVVAPQFQLEVVANDPDDNHGLECAIEARADLIATGDKHLLILGSFEGIPILNARDCLTRLNGEEQPS